MTKFQGIWRNLWEVWKTLVFVYINECFQTVTDRRTNASCACIYLLKVQYIAAVRVNCQIIHIKYYWNCTYSVWDLKYFSIITNNFQFWKIFLYIGIWFGCTSIECISLFLIVLLSMGMYAWKQMNVHVCGKERSTSQVTKWFHPVIHGKHRYVYFSF